IEDAHTASGDRSHRQLFVARNAELAYEEDVERSMKSLRDFIAYRHTAAWECEDDQVGSIDILAKRSRQATPRVVAVEKVWSPGYSIRQQTFSCRRELATGPERGEGSGKREAGSVVPV